MNVPNAEMQFITLNLITQQKWCPASLYLSTFRVEIAHTVIELVSVPIYSKYHFTTALHNTHFF